MQTLHGIAGVVGVGSLALFFGSHVYSGFSNALVLGLAILGLVAILLELHVFPGHGVSGVIGVLALGGAIVLAFGPAAIFVGVQALSVAIVLSAFFFWGSTRIFPESAFMQRLTFAGHQGPEYVASADYTALLGQSGIASSLLRPAGVAAIDGRRIDVLTEGEFISAGTPIQVTRVEGARIFVRPLEQPALKGES
jgi:membrane-bound serine protease (ClpP class)